MSDYILKFDEVEANHISQQAKTRGYTSALEYVRALVTADALVDQLHADWREADEDVAMLEAGFQQAWHEAMTNTVYPVDTLWDDIDDDEHQI